MFLPQPGKDETRNVQFATFHLLYFEETLNYILKGEFAIIYISESLESKYNIIFSYICKYLSVLML